MIFVGDVAIAPDDQFEQVGFPDYLKSQPISVNLEGAISTDLRVPQSGLCNTADWPNCFTGFELGPVFLGNNHVTDLPGGILTTQKHLAALGLQSFGAGPSAPDAQSAAVAGDIVCLGFGWPVIQCVPASVKKSGVNRLARDEVVGQVRRTLEGHPDKKLIIVFHWNYEFEPYPQPGHRALAMELVDMGVYAVIGHHPHIVGPVERYRGRILAYSLGNWMFSYKRFFRGQLRFPPKSFEQIAVEIGPRGDFVHKVIFEPPSTITYCGAESVHLSAFSFAPEFEGLSHAEYLAWFKKNRVKRKALPIYSTADRTVKNAVFDCWVTLRQRLIGFLLALRIKRRSPNGL